MNIKDKMVYAMVAMNGLILTVAIFFILNFLVNQTIVEEKQKIVNQTQKIILSGLHDVDLLLMTLMPHISLSQEEGVNKEVVIESVRNSLVAHKKKITVNSMYLIDADYQQNDPELIYKNLDTKNQLNPKTILEVLDIKKSALQNKGGFIHLVEGRNFIIAKALMSKDKKIVIGFLVAFVSPMETDIFSKLQDLSEIDRLELSDVETGENIYSFSRAQVDNYGQRTIRSMVTLDSGIINLNIVYEVSLESFILGIIPWLLLILGGGATITMTIFIKHSKENAFSLLEINNEIEKRNIELGREVTERERLNHVLRKSERENKAIINSISEVIFEISLSGEILYLNDSWEKLTGYKAVQSIGSNMFDLIHPKDEEEQRRSVSQLIKGLRPGYRVKTSIREVGGKYHSVEMAISMIRMDENRNMRVIGSFSDTEEYEKTEWALEEAERKYKSIWENSASGIYQLTMDGQLLSANPAMAHIFGFDNSDFMLREIKNAHHELFINAAERLRILKNIDLNASQEIFEFQAIRRDEQKIWIQETIRPVVDEHGTLIYFEGSIENISKRKDAEIQLQEAKKESDMANRAKSEFLSNMSHELRTPLNSIIGFSEIIRNQVFGQIEPQSYWEYARDIHESGKHLLSIINQILDISKIDAGERELKESRIDMKKLVQNTVDMQIQKIRDAGLILNDIDYTNMPMLIGEDVAIRQILTNIISNAIKFTPEGGRISISAEIDESQDFRLSVTDTGIGLDAAEVKRVTSKFGVTDGRFSKSTSGIGLGLSLVQSLMRLHGGEVEIFSQKGIGTTVVLTFPSNRIQS
jgi:PAS domain S-box-containing protein